MLFQNTTWLQRANCAGPTAGTCSQIRGQLTTPPTPTWFFCALFLCSFFVIGKRTVIRYRFIATILRPTRGNTGKTHFVDSFDRTELGQLISNLGNLGGTAPVKFHLQVTWILSSRTFMLSLTLFSSVERWENPWLSRSTLMTIRTKLVLVNGGKEKAQEANPSYTFIDSSLL